MEAEYKEFAFPLCLIVIVWISSCWFFTPLRPVCRHFYCHPL